MLLPVALFVPAYALAATAEAPEAKRQIEEVIVTAERQEASIQDTSISITAFTSEFLDQFGIRNQEDMQQYIPATVILPYDATIRGIGRSFRALGGDPGVATYMNGIYSEDLLTATGATFWDVERVEVLRGPQGTLYGRNAVGGAINILYKEPTENLEGAVRVIAGDYGTNEVYGAISGPLIDGQLSGRLNFAYRDRDGLVEATGGGSDNDSLGTENVAGLLKWTPTDAIEVNLRQNYMNIDRNFGSANGGGLVTLSQQGKKSRNTSSLSAGYRFINVNETNPLLRTYNDPSLPVLTFTNPNTGVLDTAQAIRPGYDQINGPGLNGLLNAGASLTSFNVTTPAQSAAYNACVLRGSTDASDICTATSGYNWESFEQKGTQFNASWNVSDKLTLKYLFGYNSLVYQRTTDDDNTDSPVLDRQFYVNHEADYMSNELQAFIDVTDSVSLTSGVFYYGATINQRGDFNTQLGFAQKQYTQPYVDKTSLSAAGAAALGNPALVGTPASVLVAGTGPMVSLYSAKASCKVPNPGRFCARNSSLGYLAPGVRATSSTAASNIRSSRWYGDDGTSTALDVKHGPATIGSDLLYATQTQREAFAAYTQGVWDINPMFTLTLGARYAYDDIQAEENLFRYTQTNAVNALYGGLAAINLVNGGLVPNGSGGFTPTDLVTTGGVPLAISVYRPYHRQDEKWTGRINLDWNINDSDMMYASVTSGYRSGGYSLVYFSQTPTYDPEELIAYEIGYKTQWLDNTLQINGSFYYYDYKTIQTFATEVSPIGGTSTSVLEAPGAEIWGIELETVWLVTDNATIGTNLSYTPSEYTDDLFIADVADYNIPGSLYPNFEALTENIKGNQLLQVPEAKANIWGSYKFNLPRGSNLEFFATYSWIDDVYFTPFQTEDTMADAYDRVDLRATWTSADQGWTVTGFVNNIFDEVGVLHIERTGEAYLWRQLAATTAPRLYGLELTYKFGGY